MAATSSEKFRFHIDKLNNENYRPWSFKMMMLLNREECGDVITEEKPQNPNEEWKKKAQKALQIISMSVEDNQIVYFKTCKDGREAWNVLKDIHQKDDSAAQIRIMKKLFKVNLEVGGSMRDHFNKIVDMIDQLQEMDVKMPNTLIVGIILASLNEEYEAVTTGIEAWDSSRLTFSAVRAKLMEEWEKKNKQTDGATTSGIGAAKAKNQFTCYFCNEPGHIKRNCPDLRLKLKRMRANEQKDNKDDSAKSTRLAKWYRCFSIKNNLMFSGWIVDSGATNHMSCERELFKKIDLSHRSGVIVANGERIEAKGIGEVEIELRSKQKRMKVTLSQVLWVPDLDGSLVSVRKLAERGFKIEFKENICTLRDDEESIVIAKHDGGLYKLLETQQCCIANSNELHRCVHEWHKVLSHRNLKDIRSMEGEGLRIKECKCSDECESCIRGKMSRKSFPKKATPTNEVLDCVVSDICGPMQVESVGRKRYFITFIDVHSKYTEVQFLREKSEAAEITIQYIEKMKNQIGKKPKVFRSDRGTEYLNGKLQEYLKKEGIKFQCTVGYAPEQNGVAERMNRTLVEAVRTMLIESSLPKSLWAEATMTACYTMNSIASGKNQKSPYEKVFNKQPKFTEMHEFGSDVYSMIPYEKRRKLDDKAEKLKFVGYDDASKGYRLIDKNFKIRISREVKFLTCKQPWTDGKTNEAQARAPNGENFIYLEQEEAELHEDPEEYHYMFVEEEIHHDHVQEEENNIPEEHEVHENQQLGQEEQVMMEVEHVQDENGNDNIQEEHDDGLRRSMRQNAGQMPEKYNDFHLYEARSDSETYEPRTYSEAMNCKHAKEWQKAMEEELKSIEDNRTWELVDIPKGRTAIGSKWVFKLKLDEEGKILRRKARLVAQGFSQKYGVDYDEVFAPVVRSSTFRLLLSVAGVRGYYVKHYDIKTAFLNGSLDEEIYMKQPKGFEHGIGDKVYKLKKSLYGLKQAARVWNQTLHKALIRNGCSQSETDKCLYILESNGGRVYLLVHVDDMLVAYNDEKLMLNLMNSIGKAFEMKDLGQVKHFLEIDVSKNSNGHYEISQARYIEKIITEAGLKEAKESKHPLDTGYWKFTDKGEKLNSNEEYRKLIGMLLYLATNTRPDIAAAVSILSQRVSEPKASDLTEVKRVIRYLKGTKDLKLRLSVPECSEKLCAYSDANWAEDRVDRKSNSGYICLVNGGTISWCCRKQDIVSLSSTEAEFVALTETCKEVCWLNRIAAELKIEVPETTTIYTDSQSAISMINNQKFSNRTKHIETKYHFIRDKVLSKEVILKYKSTEKNIADMLTKPLGSTKIKDLRSKAGLNQTLN